MASSRMAQSGCLVNEKRLVLPPMHGQTHTVPTTGSWLPGAARSVLMAQMFYTALCKSIDIPIQSDWEKGSILPFLAIFLGINNGDINLYGATR